MAQFRDSILLIDKVSKPLQKIQENLRKTTEQSSKLKTGFDKLNGNMQKLAPTSMKVLGATAKLTKAFVGLVGASGAITMGIKATAAYGDRIDKMSQKIGMSQKAFQEWDYIMSQNGGNVESLQMGFKTLVTQIEGVQKGSKDSIRAFRDLGVVVKDNNGNFRSQEDIFNDVVSSLQKIKNSTDRQRIAQRLLGRSYLEMAPLLNQTAEATENLRKKANRLGLILSEEDVKNAVEFTDTMDTLGRFFQTRINRALSEMLPSLTKAFNVLMEFSKPLDGMLKAIGKIVELTFKGLEFIATHQEVLIGIGAALAVIAAPAIPAALNAIAWAFIGIGASLSTVSLPLIGIGVAVGALTAGIIALWKNWDKVWSWIKETTVNVINGISNFIDSLIEKLGWIAYLIPGLGHMRIGKDLTGAIAQKMSESKSGGGASNIDNSQHNSNNSSVVNNVKNFFAGSNPKMAKLTT